MDFDIDLAKENTKDNPVYYVHMHMLVVII